jgi:3-dehydroquinate synthase
MDSEQIDRIQNLINLYGLPCRLPEDLNAGNMLSHMKRDKKVVAGQMTFVIPEKIGKVAIRKGITTMDIERILMQ